MAKPKSLVKSRTLPDGSLVCAPLKYTTDKRIEEMKGHPDLQVLATQLEDCQRAPSVPEHNAAEQDLTGRYEGTQFMCCINQAGEYIALWWSDNSANVSRYGGVLDPESNRYSLYDLDKTVVPDVATEASADGVLIPLGGDKVRIEFPPTPGSDDDFKKFSSRATLSDRIVKHLRGLSTGKSRVNEGFYANEHAPVPPAEIDLFEEIITSAETRKLLARVFEIPTNSLADLQDALGELDAHLDKELNMKSAKDGFGHFPKIRPQKLFATRTILSNNRLTLKMADNSLVGGFDTLTLSYFEWFQRALLRNNEAVAPEPFPRLRQLEITAPKGEVCKIEVELHGKAGRGGAPLGKVLKGIKGVKKKLDQLPPALRKEAEEYLDSLDPGAGVLGMAGTMTVQAKGQDPETYFATCIVFDMGGTSDAGTINLKAKGTVSLPVAWKPGFLDGGFTMFTGLLAGTGKGKELKENQFVWGVSSVAIGGHASLVFDEVQTDVNLNTIGIGWGFLNPKVIPEVKDEILFEEFVYDKEFKRERNVDFILSSATVRDHARMSLRIFAAHELALLRAASSEVEIFGLADRIGSEFYNLHLSNSRAENVETTLEDVVGPSLAANITTHGFGESVLKTLNLVFSFPDSTAAPDWRRVFALLSGNVRVNLWVPDIKDKDK